MLYFYDYNNYQMKFCVNCRKEKLVEVVLEMVKDEINNGKCMVVIVQFYYYKDDFLKVEDVFFFIKQLQNL